MREKCFKVHVSVRASWPSAKLWMMTGNGGCEEVPCTMRHAPRAILGRCHQQPALQPPLRPEASRHTLSPPL
jgi:hypothetical protein